jgi:primosomal protein N' (replication factor Y)
VESFPLFTARDLSLINEMRQKYLCTYLECIKVFIPTGIFNGMKNKKEILIYIGNMLSDKFDKEPYRTIYEIVKNNSGKYTKSALSNKFKVSLSSINTMLK